MDYGSSAAFDTYLRDLSDCHVMSAEQERAAATEIAALRRARWVALFSQPRQAPALLAAIAQALPGVLTPQIVKPVHSLLKRDAAKVTGEQLEAALLPIIDLLTEQDRDHVAAESIIADIEAIVARRTEGVRLELVVDAGTRPAFNAWVARVRRATQAFWRARSAFAKANLRLVVSMARRMGRGRMSMADLVQEGNVGLMHAIDRFDVERGFRFSTYGAWWIRHAMNRALQNKSREIRLPVHVLDILNQIRRARREWELAHGTEIPLSVLCEKTGLTEAKIERYDHYRLVNEGPVSLDAPAPGSDELTDRLDSLIVPDQTLMSDLMEQDLINAAVERALADLPSMERDILRLRFGLDDDEAQTLREIGEQYDLSRERIRQLQERALVRIRGELDRQQLM